MSRRNRSNDRKETMTSTTKDTTTDDTKAAIVAATPTVSTYQSTAPKAPDKKIGGRSRVETELLTLYNLLSHKTPVKGPWQYNLLSLMRSILDNAEHEVFHREWGALLGFFDKSRGGLFDIGHILRFGEGWPGSEMDFSLYRRLVWVCAETCDHRTRKRNAKNITFTRVFEGLSDAASNRIIGYYD